MMAASVGPYRTTVLASGKTSRMSSSRSGGTESPPTSRSRSEGSIPPPRTTSTTCRISAGTACSTLTSPTASTSVSGSRATSCGTIRTAPPARSGVTSSSSEMSNAVEASAATTSPGAKPSVSRLARRVWVSCACSTITALGVPVDPDV